MSTARDDRSERTHGLDPAAAGDDTAPDAAAPDAAAPDAAAPDAAAPDEAAPHDAAPHDAAPHDAGRAVDAAKTFEQLLAELEAVTDRLAGGELGIEAATDLYERAERLHALASARLAQVQERVDRLRTRPTPPVP